MKSCLLLSMVICVTTSVWAQSPQGEGGAQAIRAKPELPSGQLLRAPADFSRWIITFTYPTDKPKRESASPEDNDPTANARPRHTTTTKTGRIIHEEQTDVIGRITETWFDGSKQYIKRSNSSLWFEFTAEAALHTAPSSIERSLPPSGYRGLEWINASAYAGILPYGGGNCLVFVPGGHESVDLQNSEQLSKRMEAMEKVAYIDADTRLPIAVRTHTELRTFRFDSPPPTMQTVAVDLADEIKRGKEGHARLERPANRPY